MMFQSEEELRRVAHDIAMEFLRRNAPPPLSKGASYVLGAEERVNSLINEYLTAYRKAVARLQAE